MALEVEFTETFMGIPVPKGYVKITGLYVDCILGFVRMNVRCYYNEAIRVEDVDIKRVVTEAALIDAKGRKHGIEKTLAELFAEAIPQDDVIAIRQNELSEVVEEIMALDVQLQNVTGLTPFYETKFEFPIEQAMRDGWLDQAYALLKQSKLEGHSNGASIKADLTKAKDV